MNKKLSMLKTYCSIIIGCIFLFTLQSCSFTSCSFDPANCKIVLSDKSSSITRIEVNHNKEKYSIYELNPLQQGISEFNLCSPDLNKYKLIEKRGNINKGDNYYFIIRVAKINNKGGVDKEDVFTLAIEEKDWSKKESINATPQRI